MDAFIRAYGTLGYVACTDGELEDGFQKIAIYAEFIGGIPTPTHAAIQLDDGRWASKIGDFEDIEHLTVEDLTCPSYGSPALYMRRPL